VLVKVSLAFRLPLSFEAAWQKGRIAAEEDQPPSAMY
jgi:hypothetical protein